MPSNAARNGKETRKSRTLHGGIAMLDGGGRVQNCRWMAGLRHYRDRHGMSNRRLAQVLGVSHNTVRAWFRRLRPAIPNAKHRAEIERLTGVDMTPPKRPGPRKP